MPVRATQSHPRCKLCQSPERRQIDLLLERMHNREKGVGKVFVLEQFGLLGVENPTYDNIKTHRKHIEFISEETDGKLADIRERMLKELPEDASLDQKIQWATRLFEETIMARIQAGEDAGLTWDQYIKLLGIQNQRRQADQQNALFRSVGAGIAGAFAQLAGGRQEQLPAADIEGEAVEAELAEIEA